MCIKLSYLVHSKGINVINNNYGNSGNSHNNNKI